MSRDVTAVRELAEFAHGGPVLSVHLRTDLHAPANPGHVLGWLHHRSSVLPSGSRGATTSSAGTRGRSSLH